MTLITNTRAIEQLSYDVVHHVDKREYGKAHIALDDIVNKVHKVRTHISALQLHADHAARPAGGG